MRSYGGRAFAPAYTNSNLYQSINSGGVVATDPTQVVNYKAEFQKSLLRDQTAVAEFRGFEKEGGHVHIPAPSVPRYEVPPPVTTVALANDPPPPTQPDVQTEDAPMETAEIQRRADAITSEAVQTGMAVIDGYAETMQALDSLYRSTNVDEVSQYITIAENDLLKAFPEMPNDVRREMNKVRADVISGDFDSWRAIVGLFVQDAKNRYLEPVAPNEPIAIGMDAEATPEFMDAEQPEQPRNVMVHEQLVSATVDVGAFAPGHNASVIDTNKPPGGVSRLGALADRTGPDFQGPFVQQIEGPSGSDIIVEDITPLALMVVDQPYRARPRPVEPVDLLRPNKKMQYSVEEPLVVPLTSELGQVLHRLTGQNEAVYSLDPQNGRSSLDKRLARDSDGKRSDPSLGTGKGKVDKRDKKLTWGSTGKRSKRRSELFDSAVNTLLPDDDVDKKLAWGAKRKRSKRISARRAESAASSLQAAIDTPLPEDDAGGSATNMPANPPLPDDGGQLLDDLLRQAVEAPLPVGVQDPEERAAVVLTTADAVAQATGNGASGVAELTAQPRRSARLAEKREREAEKRKREEEATADDPRPSWGRKGKRSKRSKPQNKAQIKPQNKVQVLPKWASKKARSKRGKPRDAKPQDAMQMPMGKRSSAQTGDVYITKSGRASRRPARYSPPG